MALKWVELLVVVAVLKRLKEKSRDPKALTAEIAKLDRQIDGQIAELVDWFDLPRT